MADRQMGYSAEKQIEIGLDRATRLINYWLQCRDIVWAHPGQNHHGRHGQPRRRGPWAIKAWLRSIDANPWNLAGTRWPLPDRDRYRCCIRRPAAWLALLIRPTAAAPRGSMPERGTLYVRQPSLCLRYGSLSSRANHPHIQQH